MGPKPGWDKALMGFNGLRKFQGNVSAFQDDGGLGAGVRPTDSVGCRFRGMWVGKMSGIWGMMGLGWGG